MRYGPVRFYGLGALLLWLLGRLLSVLIVTVGAAITHPRTTAGVAGLGVLAWLVVEHPHELAVGVTLAALVGDVWALVSPRTFRRQVALRALAWCRSVVVYRRSWARAMRAAGLVVDDERVPARWRVPRLSRVRCSPTHDLVRVRGLLGQTVDAWEVGAPVLARAFGARDVWVVRGDDRRLTLEFERGGAGRAWARP